MQSEGPGEVIVTGGSFFEGPRWHADRWWVSDFYRRHVLSFDEYGEDVREELRLEDRPSGLGWRSDGTLMVVSMDQQAVMRRNAVGALEEVAQFRELTPGPANDMVVDTADRCWVSNVGYDVMIGEPHRTAAVVRIDVDGAASVAAERLAFPNGLVILDGGRTLVVAETVGARLTAFTIDPSGDLVDRRLWGQLWEGAGPDGCCADAQGRIWVADAFGRRSVLVEEGGKVVDERPSPWGMRTYACMLGGREGRALIQCCSPTFLAGDRRDARDAVIIHTIVDVPRAGLP